MSRSYSRCWESALERALDEVRVLEGHASTEHLLYGALTTPGANAVTLLRTLGLDPDYVLHEVKRQRPRCWRYAEGEPVLRPVPSVCSNSPTTKPSDWKRRLLEQNTCCSHCFVRVRDLLTASWTGADLRWRQDAPSV